jgi:hypothetical protein
VPGLMQENKGRHNMPTSLQPGSGNSARFTPPFGLITICFTLLSLSLD